MNDEDIKITNDGLDPEFSDDDVVATPPVIGADGDADSDIDLDDDDDDDEEEEAIDTDKDKEETKD